jgi:hypothetical protein
MPDITNPQVIRFSNENGRPVADAWCSLYNAMKTAASVWAGQGIGALVPNTADLIADGSDVDGRGRLTGANLISLKGIMDTFLADAEASSNAKRNAFFAAAVNPKG